MVGRLFSSWDGLCSGAMSVSRRVDVSSTDYERSPSPKGATPLKFEDKNMFERRLDFPNS